jgi:glycosyltransferase involved in cell wall biosynthesis
MKTIGVAVPCYIHHLEHLKRMLESVEKNTMKPDIVIISCSSMGSSDSKSEIIDLTSYSFPVKIIYHKERLNAAQNRNIAAAHLETDIISFFDADDIMHPQRIEAISGAFEKYYDCKIVLHGFLDSYTKSFETFETINYEPGVLRHAPSGCAIVNYNWRSLIHQSQVSVTNDVLLKYKFNESVDHERREDAVFCGTILRDEPTRNVYIPHTLSAYESAGEWIN